MPRYSLFVPLIWVLLSWLCQILPVLASEIHEDALSAGQTLLARHHGSQPIGPPRTPSKGLVIAHALLCVLGFAICLPGGAILARYLRTSRPWWYTGHWIAQFGIAGPIILIGVVLGYMLGGQIGKTPGDDHKNLGNAVFYLYIVQCILGAVIHFFKPKNAKRRPIQNYFHAILGLTIIFLGMYQIHTGYAQEWPKYAGMGALPGGVNVLWILWFILLVVVYAAGLLYLRKQYTQEAAARIHAETAFVGTGAVTNHGTNYSMDILRWQPRPGNGAMA